MKITIAQGSIDRLKQVLGDLSKSYKREIAIAANETAKKVAFEASKQLKQELKVAVKILKKAVKQNKKATPDKTRTSINFFGGYPIPLKYFGAKSDKKTGRVTFRIDPKTKGKATLLGRQGAFIPDKYSGNVVKRTSKERGPLRVQYGPSPGSVYKRIQLVPKMLVVAQAELPKQVQRRIRFLTLKANDGLRGKQK